MPHPKSGYFVDGEKIPGTTTITSRFKDSGALIYWGWQRGKDGLELYESRDKAAELGTIIHSIAEQFISGHLKITDFTDCLSTADLASVLSAFNAFQEWFESSKFEIIAQEESLVSRVHRFGGTFDAVAKDSKERIVLIDFKTSNSIYPEYILQLGAYRILWNENHPEMPLTGGSHICRFAKEKGDFAHHFFPNIDEAEKGFLLMRQLYAIDKELKKRC